MFPSAASIGVVLGKFLKEPSIMTQNNSSDAKTGVSVDDISEEMNYKGFKPSPAEVLAAGVEGRPVIALGPERKSYFSYDERAVFYSGQDRVTLQSEQIKRVRELEECNDYLQRDIFLKEEALRKSPENSLTLLASIEHAKMMIACNTGEILKIYAQDEQRYTKASEIDVQNRQLREEIMDMEERWANCHDMTQRTKLARDIFLSRDHIKKNLDDLERLSKF